MADSNVESLNDVVTLEASDLLYVVRPSTDADYKATGTQIATLMASLLTTANIADSSNKRYVSDANLVVIGNTSGANTGDQTTVSGNAGTATALATARAIGGVNFDGTAAITPTQIQPAAENSDTTCFVAFFGAASGTAQQPKYNTALTFNASTGAFGATSFVGAGTGLTGTAASLTAGVASTVVSGGTGATASVGDNSTKVATTAYVNDAVNNVVINTQSDDYTLVLGDNGKFIDMTKGTATVLTIPANASVVFPVGTQITVSQGGAGQVTVAITSDTLNNPGATLKTRVQYSQFVITKVASTVWRIIGDAAAT